MTACPSSPSSLRNTLVSAALALAAAAALASPLAAQQSDESGGDGRGAPVFRAAQWGAQFTVSSGFYGAGVLRFRSPNTAWTLDGTASVGMNSVEFEGSDSRDLSGASASVQAGLRRYDAPHGAIRTFRGAGLLAGLSRDRLWGEGSPGVPGQEQKTSGYRAGAFAELGANYFVTPHLALGARGVATATYSRTKATIQSAIFPPATLPPTRVTTSSTSLGLGSVQFQVMLLF